MKTYVTLLSSDDYLEGILTLSTSLVKVCSKYPLLVLLTEEVSKYSERMLLKMGLHCQCLEPRYQLPGEVRDKIEVPHWRNTFAKLQVFNLTDYEKLVFLDADMLVVRNIDHLFERTRLSASTSTGMIKMFQHWTMPNTGLMVLMPEQGLGDKIFAVWPEVAADKITFSDQDLIHRYFGSYWKQDRAWELPCLYNCHMLYISMIAREKGYNLRLAKPDDQTFFVLHFASRNRPWLMDWKPLLNYFLRRLARAKFLEIKGTYLYLMQLRQARAQLNAESLTGN